HAPFRQVLQHGVFLGDPHRIVGRDEGGGGGEDDACGGGGDVRQQGRGGRRDKRRIVVLANGEDVEPDFLCLLSDLDQRVDPLSLTGGVTRDWVASDVADRHDAEMHSGDASPPGQLYAFAINTTAPGGE